MMHFIVLPQALTVVLVYFILFYFFMGDDFSISTLYHFIWDKRQSVLPPFPFGVSLMFTLFLLFICQLYIFPPCFYNKTLTKINLEKNYFGFNFHVTVIQLRLELRQRPQRRLPSWFAFSLAPAQPTFYISQIHLPRDVCPIVESAVHIV